MSEPDPERDAREIEELLRRTPGERCDAGRRDEARRAFLAAHAGEGDGAGERSRPASPYRMRAVMKEGSEAGAHLHEEEPDGFTAWLASIPPAAPSPVEIRRHARLAFLSAVASEPPPLRARRSVRRLVWVAAAAAILAVTFLLPQPERWRAELDGRLTFDGSEYAPGDETRLAAALERSGALETGASLARLDLGDALTLEVLANSSLSLPPLPELDGIAPVALELARGETYVRTRPGYAGDPIVVRTAVADVALHGTTVGVLVDEQGTCVCVAEGTARVTSGRLAHGFQDVGERWTLRIYADPNEAPKAVAFPAEGDAHTGDLVQFLRAP